MERLVRTQSPARQYSRTQPHLAIPSIPGLQLIEALEERLGKTAKKEMLPHQPGERTETDADIDPLEKDFGFKPSTALETGIDRFVSWYEENSESGEFACEDFRLRGMETCPATCFFFRAISDNLRNPRCIFQGIRISCESSFTNVVTVRFS